MSLGISLIVLLAAVLHASWNALLRAGEDRLWSITVMCIAIALVCAALVPFVDVPAAASWGCVVTSALLHVGYNLFLVRTYRSGDLGQTYPISRGSSPLLVTLGAALFVGELPDAASMAGVALISGGIISLAFQGQRRERGIGTLPYALGTGCFIGAYSVTDGIGVRLSGAPLGYTLWMCMLWGLMAPLAYAVARDWRSLVRGPRETAMAAVGGVVSLVAYGIVIFAMSLGPMGPVSALRESSVVFAALIGRLFLGERLSVYRIGACLVVVAGALLIGHGEGGRPARLSPGAATTPSARAPASGDGGKSF
ncbi:DMT family transporter [Sphingomonas quercus]|uniref:DMT family transporter n=1 Tax=Sphingomonas quercus TaxID=2842451 RepID=A0ABS6BG35_9SPHN|nr:DMT family transporter [Sphingomonas quercus]MBU3077249.1 DMT family transporter [Sphingomonas quercus]